MGLIVKLNTFSAGDTIIASEHNGNYDTIYNEFNGNIDNANLKSGAAIEDNKLAQITTASKVSGAAVTLLANIPNTAGVIPGSNTGIANNFLDLSTTSTDITILRQFGWNFINPDGGGSGTALITFPEAFSDLPYLVNLTKYSQSSGDPTERDFDTQLSIDSADEVLRLTTFTGTSMTVGVIGGAQNVRQMFFWEATGPA